MRGALIEISTAMGKVTPDNDGGISAPSMETTS